MKINSILLFRKGSKMMDIGNEIEVSRKKKVHKFIVSGKTIEISEFFNLNYLEKLFDNYSTSKDYRNTFSQVVFYMY